MAIKVKKKSIAGVVYYDYLSSKSRYLYVSRPIVTGLFGARELARHGTTYNIGNNKRKREQRAIHGR